MTKIPSVFLRSSILEGIEYVKHYIELVSLYNIAKKLLLSSCLSVLAAKQGFKLLLYIELFQQLSRALMLAAHTFITTVIFS